MNIHKKSGSFCSGAAAWLKKYDQTWRFCALVNLILAMLLLLLMIPVFETNDDTTIYALTGGGKGRFDPHLIFSNILLGRLLTGLYALAPQIQWYSVLQYFVLYLSFTALLHVLLTRLRPGMAAIVFTALYCFFGYEGYIIIQFSKTAGYATCAGILLMFHALEQTDSALQTIQVPSGRTAQIQKPYSGRFSTWCELVCGLLLALTGSMYRTKEFLLCAGVMSGIGIYTLFLLRWKRSRALARTIFAYIGSFALLFVLFLALSLYDSQSYKKDASWAEYLEYNDLRSNLMDYGFPDYDTYADVYERCGLSREDVTLYRYGNYADPEVFSIETIRALTEVSTPKRPLNLQFVKDYFHTFPVGFLKLYVFTCFLLICGLWVFFGRKTRAEWAALLYEAAVIGLIYAYLFHVGRSLVSRTETALWLAASLLVVWLLDQERVFFTARTAAAFCSFALIFNLKGWKSEFRFTPARQQQLSVTKSERAFQQMIGEDDSHLYLTKIGTISPFLAYGPFDVIPRASLQNICMLGGWEYGCETNNSVLTRYGVENPYRDMIDHPQVILVDDHIQDTVNYLKAHYQEQVKADLIRKAGGRKFYVIRTKEPELDLDSVRNADQDPEVMHQQAVTLDKKELKLEGCLYRKNTDSFAQRVYLQIIHAHTSESTLHNVTTQTAADKADRRDGLYGDITCKLNLKKAGLTQKDLRSGQYQLRLILETEAGLDSISIKLPDPE